MLDALSRLRWPWAAALLLLACPPPNPGGTATLGDPEDTFDSDSESASASASASSGVDTLTTAGLTSSSGGGTTGDTSTTGDTDGTTSDSDGTTGGTDSDSTTDGTTDGPKSCKKIDVLFAIDNSPDMTGAHWRLSQMLPQFIDRFETEFSNWDYHMMVVKGDGSWGNPLCEERCELVGNCDGAIEDYPCEYDPDTCDLTLGAGVIISAGSSASNTICPIEGDQRYMKTGQSELEETLDCLRRVGFANSYERPQVQSLLNAVSPKLNAEGACNEGFLRDDAYLVIFMVMSETDYYTEGTPQEWAKTLLATKGGKFDKVFLIGLFDDGYKGGLCGIPDGNNDDLFEWVDEIYHSSSGSMCEQDYMPHMDKALNYVLSDCQE